MKIEKEPRFDSKNYQIQQKAMKGKSQLQNAVKMAAESFKKSTIF